MDAPRLNTAAFCAQVCRRVRFRPDHEAITAELTEHMEDRKTALLAAHPDLTLWEAERQAVAAMGDPEEIGRELDKSHSPLLGWFQIWFRRAVWTLAALILLVTLPQARETISNLTAPLSHGGNMASLLEHYDGLDVAADLTPAAAWQYQGYTFSIPRAVVTRSYDGTLTLFYTMKAAHPDPRLRGPEFWEWLWAEDDLGNTYPSCGQVTPARSSPVLSEGNLTVAYPFASYYDLWVDQIDPEAASVTLHFDRYGENAIHFTLPLKGET